MAVLRFVAGEDMAQLTAGPTDLYFHQRRRLPIVHSTFSVAQVDAAVGGLRRMEQFRLERSSATGL